MNQHLLFTVACAVLPFFLAAESTQDYFDCEEQSEWALSEGPEYMRTPFEYSPQFFDLHDLKQDFVIQTKRINLSGFPCAFNASIIDWNGFLLMSFRTYSENGSTNNIGLVLLDQDCNPVGEPQLIAMPFTDDYCFTKRQDPRLIQSNGHLYLVYNNHLKTVTDREIRRMLVAELFFDGRQFYAEQSNIFLDFEGESPAKTEKNWVPFDYDNTLLLSYGVNPHQVLQPILGTNTCQTIATSRFLSDWQWGALRGGTQALKIGDEYLAFFHSSRNLPSLHSNGKVMLHYFMGAYTFSAEPPFTITKVSPDPIIGDHFYDGPMYKTWKPLRAVFPCGMVVQGDTIWVSYGKQDHEVWVAKIDKQQLLNSLVPVNP